MAIEARFLVRYVNSMQRKCTGRSGAKFEEVGIDLIQRHLLGRANRRKKLISALKGPENLHNQLVTAMKLVHQWSEHHNGVYEQIRSPSI